MTLAKTQVTNAENTFGKRLKKARKSVVIDGDAMSQDVLAKRLDVSKSTISKWERDDSYPMRDSYLDEIARICCVSMSWLVDGVGPMLVDGAHPTPQGSRNTVMRLSALPKVEAKTSLEWMMVGYLIAKAQSIDPYLEAERMERLVSVLLSCAIDAGGLMPSDATIRTCLASLK